MMNDYQKVKVIRKSGKKIFERTVSDTVKEEDWILDGNGYRITFFRGEPLVLSKMNDILKYIPKFGEF